VSLSKPRTVGLIQDLLRAVENPTGRAPNLSHPGRKVAIPHHVEVRLAGEKLRDELTPGVVMKGGLTAPEQPDRYQKIDGSDFGLKVKAELREWLEFLSGPGWLFFNLHRDKLRLICELNDLLRMMDGPATGPTLPAVTADEQELLLDLADAHPDRRTNEELATKKRSLRTVSRRVTRLMGLRLIDRDGGRRGGVTLTALGWELVHSCGWIR